MHHRLGLEQEAQLLKNDPISVEVGNRKAVRLVRVFMKYRLSLLRLGPLLASGAAAFLLASCTDNQVPEQADSFLAQLRAAKYEGWRRPTNYPVRTKSNAPHGDEVDMFVNPVMQKAIDEGKPLSQWPVGAIIAKNGYSGGELDLIAAMEKRADGWFWVEYNGSGKALYSGKPSLCIDCHKSAADSVFSVSLPK
jgi:hypothetical protein